MKKQIHNAVAVALFAFPYFFACNSPWSSQDIDLPKIGTVRLEENKHGNKFFWLNGGNVCVFVDIDEQDNAFTIAQVQMPYNFDDFKGYITYNRAYDWTHPGDTSGLIWVVKRVPKEIWSYKADTTRYAPTIVSLRDSLHAAFDRFRSGRDTDTLDSLLSRSYDLFTQLQGVSDAVFVHKEVDEDWPVALQDFYDLDITGRVKVEMTAEHHIHFYTSGGRVVVCAPSRDASEDVFSVTELAKPYDFAEGGTRGTFMRGMRTPRGSIQDTVFVDTSENRIHLTDSTHSTLVRYRSAILMQRYEALKAGQGTIGTLQSIDEFLQKCLAWHEQLQKARK